MAVKIFSGRATQYLAEKLPMRMVNHWELLIISNSAMGRCRRL
jgi:hypothetical protein